MTKIFKNGAFQGDFAIRRIEKLPADVVPVEPENGKYVIAHSETGHHHLITTQRVKAFRPKKPDIYTLFLQIDEPLAGETLPEIEHLRSFDTHESIRPESGGIFEIKRQREHTPEGWRRAAD